jgi:hypothetical protein
MTVTISGTSGIVNDATDLSYTGTLTGSTGVVNIGSGQVYKDASGNVGIGTTPSAWDSGRKAIEFDAGNSVYSNYTNQIGLTSNAYFNGTNWIYKTTASAGYYTLGQATHVWNVAPSGTAGNAITFTQAMTLDSSGNLLVGATATQNNNRLYVQSSSFVMGLNGTNATGEMVRFYNNGSTAGTISYGASTVAYNTSSDYRLKEDITPMTGALATVGQLKPCTYKWKKDGSAGQGFIAHELQAIVPDCVAGEKDGVDADGQPEYQGIDTSFLVATLTAAIQEQQTLITALTTRITALEAQIV